MGTVEVVENFVSINGEGRRAGELAVFLRMKGCNLQCSYCDTTWANEKDADFTPMTKEELYAYVKKTKVKNVTITGGEPLLQKNILEVLEYFAKDENLRVEIETNGSVDLKPFAALEHAPSFTMDYKCPGSGMCQHMCLDNFSILTEKDTVKFVVGSREDLEAAKTVIENYKLQNRVAIYFSPVFGRIEPEEIVTFLIENQLNDVKLQLQLHKYIWDPQKRGV